MPKISPFSMEKLMFLAASTVPFFVEKLLYHRFHSPVSSRPCVTILFILHPLLQYLLLHLLWHPLPLLCQNLQILQKVQLLRHMSH